VKRRAFEAQKKAYLKGAALWDVPLKETEIEHTYKGQGDGEKIPLYIRTPKDAKADRKCPVMLLITGLDGHRPDNSEVNSSTIFNCVYSPVVEN
jgi:hypothetical protein